MHYVPAGSSYSYPKASSSGRGFHLGEFPFLHTLHQDQPPFVLEHSAQLWIPFIAYILIIVCYVFSSCGILLVLLQRISFRVFYTFLLCPGCWASTHQTVHLGSQQTMLSTTDTSCYSHCDDNSSSRELQCQLMIIISLPELRLVVSPIYSTQ